MTRWTGTETGVLGIAERLRATSLGSAFPWCTAIAGDENFRYCPTCLSCGFAAAGFQIDALVRCPIHGDLLLSSCRECSAPTPRYAVCRSAFREPMRCTACKESLARGWDLRDLISVWKAPRRCKALIDLDRWCRQINHAGVDWRGLQDWPSGVSLKEQRETAFHVLRRLVPLELPKKILRDVPLRVEFTLEGSPARPTELEQEQECRHDRRQIYKSIRRHFARKWSIRFPSFNWFYDDDLISDGSGCILTCDSSISIFRHAFHLWRARFEASQTAAKRPRGERGLSLNLRDKADGAELFSEARAWGVFALACLQADCASARRWNERMRLALAAAGSESRRWLLLPVVQELADHLSPKRRAWPASLTAVSSSIGTSESGPRVVLFRESWGTS